MGWWHHWVDCNISRRDSHFGMLVRHMERADQVLNCGTIFRPHQAMWLMLMIRIMMKLFILVNFISFYFESKYETTTSIVELKLHRQTFSSRSYSKTVLVSIFHSKGKWMLSFEETVATTMLHIFLEVTR